jgi:hypothetical protein
MEQWHRKPSQEIEWRVWYSDGATLSNLEVAPMELRRWGVLCIAERSAEHGRIIFVGHDYYWLDRGKWVGGDFCGLLDHITQPLSEHVVLIGRAVPPDRFHRVHGLALADPDLPEKTSTDWCEATSL